MVICVAWHPAHTHDFDISAALQIQGPASCREQQCIPDEDLAALMSMHMTMTEEWLDLDTAHACMQAVGTATSCRAPDCRS